MSIWFVTPAWQRYALTEVCLAQRARVIKTLAQHGVEAHCVVVADDENLDIAAGFGFATVLQDNEWLGRKFNDGMEYAGQHGATWIVPIGSDSWIDPAYFLPLPEFRYTRTSSHYCVVESDRMAELAVRDGKGAGPYMFHRGLMLRNGFRPAKDELERGIDGSTIRGLGGLPRWKHRPLHPYQYVGFRGVPHLSPYERLRDRWGVAEHPDPWVILAEHYPADLVKRARRVMAAQTAVAA